MEQPVEIELSHTETILLALGSLGLLLAWLPRIYLFARRTEDPALRSILADHFVTQFMDFLAVRLVRSWRTLSPESKLQSTPYLALYWLGAVLLLSSFILALSGLG